LKEPDVDGIIILRWLFGKMDVACTGLIWFRIGTGGDEPSGSIKCGEFLDWLRTS
jgi:hypothetical protein